MGVLYSKDQDRRDPAPVEAAVRSAGCRFGEGPKEETVWVIEIDGQDACEIRFQLMATWPGKSRDVRQRGSRIELFQPLTD